MKKLIFLLGIVFLISLVSVSAWVDDFDIDQSVIDWTTTPWRANITATGNFPGEWLHNISDGSMFWDWDSANWKTVYSYDFKTASKNFTEGSTEAQIYFWQDAHTYNQMEVAVVLNFNSSTKEHYRFARHLVFENACQHAGNEWRFIERNSSGSEIELWSEFDDCEDNIWYDYIFKLKREDFANGTALFKGYRNDANIFNVTRENPLSGGYGALHYQGRNWDSTSYARWINVSVLSIVFPVGLSNYDLTSANSIYDNNWNTDPRTNASTLDTTPTITFDTNVSANCRMGITNDNYAVLGGTRQCSGGEGTSSHTCTLSAGDAFSVGNYDLYVGCTYDNGTGYSSNLPIQIRSAPTQANLTFPTNNTDFVYNSTEPKWTWLNWTNSTDEDLDDVFYFVELDGSAIQYFECYQEFANNKTSCGGRGEGNYNPFQDYFDPYSPYANMVDGDFGTYAEGSPALSRVNITYHKAAGAEGAVWRTKTSFGSVNLTIPDACFAQSQLKLQVEVLKGFADDYTKFWCYNGTSLQILQNETGSRMYEEGIYWNTSVITVNNYNYTFSKPNVTGESYNWTIITTDGDYNSTNQHFFFTLTPETHVYLNSLETNRTYEYGSIAELKVNTTGTGEVCLSIYDLNYGIDYVCAQNEVTYNYTIQNYTYIDYYVAGDTVSLYFRRNSSDNANLALPTFLDVVSATIDVRGNNSPKHATFFDDWNTNQTAKTYTFASNVTQTINLTLRDSNILQSAKFNVNSSGGAYGLTIDACADGTIDVNKTNFFYAETEIAFDDISSVNDCINTSKSFNTVPFNITFSVGSTVTVGNLLFKRSEVYKPKDVFVDAGNDSLIDTALPGEISGLTGKVNSFNDDTTSKTLSSDVDAGNSSVCNVDIPVDNTIVSFTIEVTATSKNGTFTENFNTLNYVNESTTTALINQFFGQVRNNKDGSDRPIESYIYSKQVPQVKTDIGEITFEWTDEEGLVGSSEIDYFFSADNKVHWQEISGEGTQTITYPGNDSYWYAHFTTNLQNASYAYSVSISGLDTQPANFSVDIGNDGSLEYNGTTELSSAVTELSIPTSTFSTYQVNPSEGVSTIPINLSFVGKGSVLVGGVELVYSTDDMIIGSGTINAFINNIKTSLNYVTSLIIGDSISTGVQTNMSINDDVIVSSSVIEIGGYGYK